MVLPIVPQQFLSSFHRDGRWNIIFIQNRQFNGKCEWARKCFRSQPQSGGIGLQEASLLSYLMPNSSLKPYVRRSILHFFPHTWTIHGSVFQVMSVSSFLEVAKRSGLDLFSRSGTTCSKLPSMQCLPYWVTPLWMLLFCLNHSGLVQYFSPYLLF